MPTFSTQTGADLSTAAHWLQAGECVAIPTETVYGLAANALDPAAVVKIFEVKNRPAFDPLIVHITGITEVERYASAFPAPMRRLAERFWPGPLTLLLPKRDLIPDLVTSGLPRVGLRAPAHPMAQALLRRLPFPLAAPSANPFGYISPTTAQHVADQLQGRIPYILDGGPCTVGVESTIVGMEDNTVVVYRLGGLALEILEAVAGTARIQLNQSSNPSAPGMLKSHYAPRKPVLLCGRNPADQARVHGALRSYTRVGLLAFQPYPPEECPFPAVVRQIALTGSGDLAEAAQNLFAALRTLDQADVEVIVAETSPDTGLGRAINDRLRRAAAPDNAE